MNRYKKFDKLELSEQTVGNQKPESDAFVVDFPMRTYIYYMGLDANLMQGICRRDYEASNIK